MGLDRELYKTKLCSLYRRGHCPRQSCSFAHGNTELRRFSASGQEGDLRERLERRHSPPNNRPHLKRDGKDYANNERYSSRVQGNSRTSSPPTERYGRERKRHKPNEVANVSADLKYSDDGDSDEHKIDGYSNDCSKDTLVKELKAVRIEIIELANRKDELEALLQQKQGEAEQLAMRNSELESTLLKEQEDYKRLGYKIKRFIKLHLRLVRAQEEIKRSQDRLQRLVEEIPTDSTQFANQCEDSNVNVVSDGEPEQHLQKDLPYTRNKTNKHESSDAGREEINVDADDNESMKKDPSFSDKTGAVTHSATDASKLSNMKIITDTSLEDREIQMAQSANSTREMVVESKKEDIQVSEEFVTKDFLHSKTVAEKAKGFHLGVNLPSTGIAAKAENDLMDTVDIEGNEELEDDFVWKKEMTGSVSQRSSNIEVLSLGKPLLKNLSSLANRTSDSYNEYKGDDEEVDIDRVDFEDRGFDLNLQAEPE